MRAPGREHRTGAHARGKPDARSRPEDAQLIHQTPVNSSRPITRAINSIRTSVTPMATALAAAAVGSKEYLR